MIQNFPPGTQSHDRQDLFVIRLHVQWWHGLRELGRFKAVEPEWSTLFAIGPLVFAWEKPVP